MTRYLLELTLRNPATGADTVLRLTERSSYTTRPADTPSQAWYRPWAKRLVNYERDLIAGGKTFGGSGGGIGEALLNNASRWLDPYQSYSWRSARILQGPLGRFATYGEFVPILSLDVAGRDYVGDEVSVRFREGRAAWDREIPRTTYAGTNSGPSGLEGNANLTGVLKPLVIGAGNGLPVQWANPSLLIAQWHAGPVDFVGGVQVGGGSITITSDVGASITNPSLSIAAGACVLDNSRGLIRFGSQPMRPVTVDGSVLPLATVAACAGQLAALLGSSDPISLDAGFGDQFMGWVPGGGETAAAILDIFAQGAAAWWSVDDTRTLRGGQFPALTAAPAFTIAARDIANVDLVSSSADRGDTPVWRVEVSFSRNWQPLAEADIDPSVTSPTARAGLMRTWRATAIVQDASILTAYPNAEILKIEAPVVNTSAGTALGAQLLSLYREPRGVRMLEVPARISPGQLPIGRLCEFTHRGQAHRGIYTGPSTEDGRTFKLRMFG